MGSGIHGGFGKTSGYRKAFPGTSILVKKGDGEIFGKYAKKATPKDGYTDVIIHGSQNSNNAADVGAVFHNNKWVELDQRRLATFLKKDDGYTGGKIRLISCGAGAGKFAQNLANKMGGRGYCSYRYCLGLG